MNTPKPKPPAKNDNKTVKRSKKDQAPKKSHILEPHLTHKPFEQFFKKNESV